jgi:hypothetical protein
VDKKTILLNLRLQRDWVKGQTASTMEGGWQAQNIMVGCVQAINSCGRSIQDWLGREKDRRSLLRRIQQTYVTRRGKRLLVKLIDLAASELGACIWLDDFAADALPLQREPRPKRKLSEAHKRAMREGYRRARERGQKAREARLEGATC